MNMMRKNRLAVLLILVTAQIMTAEAQAADTGLLGRMEMQMRWFPSSSPTPSPISASKEKKSNGAVLSIALEPEWKYITEDRKHNFKITPFARYDAEDKERTHVDMRELYWMYSGDDWKLLAGINQVFWGVTESHHLVDIINQTDLVEDVDGEDKLGQPMIQLTLGLSRILGSKESGENFGKLTVFLMPGFRERTFPGSKGRFTGQFPVDTKAIYRGGASKDRIDLALRYSHSIEKWDIGLHYFHGNSREPRLIPRMTAQGLRLAPQYELINQVGADIQYTDDAWLWKFEGIVREGHGDTFGALAAGVEYTFYQPFKTWDVGLLAEYLYDDRDQKLAPRTTADNDIFLGTRLSFNDVQDTQLLAGIISDLDTNAYTFNLEAERRLTDNISAELFARLFDGGDAPSENMLPGIEKDDYVQLSVLYHF
uniref:Uncharacterized protein n=1 Tax=Candidatus Kentrum sp. LPFa TaxID=2126335 RepID=A0A450WJA4_9GAMM|nr:MAG: hypothetical protein BECKLPF1236B_GA0070989_11108 [Candidatus Kentron sp. LPFa]